MTYESWRISFQSSEQAARSAYSKVEELSRRVSELEAELRDDHWPHGATVKLRWDGPGYQAKFGWAKRNAEGGLVSVHSGTSLDESMWEVVRERNAQPPKGGGYK